MGAIRVPAIISRTLGQLVASTKTANREAVPWRGAWASPPDAYLDAVVIDLMAPPMWVGFYPADDGRGDGLVLHCQREGIVMDDRERFYTYREVCELTTLSRTTIWRLRKKKAFPAEIEMPNGRIVWRARDVIAWMCHLPAD